MQLPSYQEFLATLTPDKIEQIMSDAKMKCTESADCGAGEQISAISWTISLELMALYHQWLEASFGEY